MAKIRLECLYCGEIWNDTVWSTDAIVAKCARCNEEKLIKVKQIDEDGNNDIYGYNYVPPKVGGGNDY